MTAAAVLGYLVLVYFTFGVASNQVADHKWLNRKRTMETSRLQNTDLMEPRTNVYNPRIKSDIKYETSSYVGPRSDNFRKFDEVYTEIDKDITIYERNSNLHNYKAYKNRNSDRDFVMNFLPQKRFKREEGTTDPRCSEFNDIDPQKGYIQHPHEGGTNNYYSNINCVAVISANEGQVIELTFVDKFHIEYHPDCSYDYLEIRDGSRGYAKLMGKVCGENFPSQLTTTGPDVWLKFSSDDTIEYEGFQINFRFIQMSSSYRIPDECYTEFTDVSHGLIDSMSIPAGCENGHALDMLWKIVVEEQQKIYLNFTVYTLAKPNECEENFVQVFGNKLEADARLAFYCGSVANPVTTKDANLKDPDDKSNIMYVRLYSTVKSTISANFTAYRSIDPQKDVKCTEDEFDCEDNTCIDINLKCDSYANCRLKADEEKEICDQVTESMFSKFHIKVILIIFCLILSGMTFVFFFKCIRKLYQDHKIIKEHIRQSCEDRLDMVSSRLTLDAKRLQRDSEPRASLERDNHTNEMFKKQRKLSQQKIRPTSIDSDFIQETRLDLDDEPWRREVEPIPDTEEVRLERNGRTRKSDLTKKEESIRSKKESEEKKQIRDVSVGAPDTKESGCQTRESLFQTDPAISSDGSGTTNSRGFSTFGYSGATIIRPSPPQTNTSQITIELLRQATEQEEKPQKKFPDRRPMSTETTRSAPDVIIVSKPVR